MEQNVQYSKLLATARSDLLLLSSYVRDMHNEIGNDSEHQQNVFGT
jgi:hypothetical protein